MGKTADFCPTIFNSHPNDTSLSVPAGYRRTVDEVPSMRSSISKQASSMKSAMQPSYNSTGRINGVNMPMPNGTTVLLDLTCTRMLVYPEQKFREFVREDVVLIVTQFWLAGLSFLAIMYESVPHLLSVLAARALMTNWSGISMWRAGLIQNFVQRLVTSDSPPCRFDVFPMYFQRRDTHGILNLVLNIVGLLVAAYFSFKLYKIYNTQTFKSIGPPKEILRMYRFFLAFFVCLQLSVFFLVAATSLWIDQLLKGAISSLTRQTAVYLALFIISTVILVPWTMMGWFSVRREMKKLMTGFFVVGFFLIGFWLAMFASLVFRWTFLTWSFMASLMTEAFVAMTASCILGVICWRNFDKGLAHYLYVEDVLSKDDFQPGMFTDDVEKTPTDSPGKQQYPTFEDLRENRGLEALAYQ